MKRKESALSLRILVDECILDKLLIAKLRGAGHDILTVEDLDLRRKPDHAVLEAAIADNRMVITINCVDFVELAERRVKRGAKHPGILLVYRYNVPVKELSHDDIVKAIANLQATGLALENGCHKLNDYKY